MRASRYVPWLAAAIAASLGAFGCDGGGGGDEPDGGDGDGGGGAGCDGCLVLGVCYEEGESPPGNVCRICDPDASATSWTNDDGRECNDGLFCNGADLCEGGTCSSHGGDPCDDDGLYCNGREYCDEETNACAHSGDPCADDGVFCNGRESCDEEVDLCRSPGDPCGEGAACIELEGRCCAPLEDPICDELGDVVQIDTCGRPVALVADCPDGEHATCEAGRCRCEQGWAGDGCETCVVHVRPGGHDSSDGSSWITALATVQAGLDRAEELGCEVWVAEGTYLPTEGAGRAATFALRSGVAVYGGFAGIETGRDDRDPAANPTVLSGDVGEPGFAADNVHHVVTAALDARLDGFTITGGYAYCSPGSEPCNMGGGVYASGTSFTLARCRVEDNYAARWGGGIYVDATFVRIEGCTIADNVAERPEDTYFASYGGGFYGEGSFPTIVSSVIMGNRALQGGGGYCDDCLVTLTNSLLLRNVATSWGGGGLHIEGTNDGRHAVRNSVVWLNVSQSAGVDRGIRYPSWSTDIASSIIQEWPDGTPGAVDEDPRFENTDPIAGPLDLHLRPSSPCVDAGNDVFAPATDMEGNERFDDPDADNCPVAGEPECEWFSDIGPFERQGS